MKRNRYIPGDWLAVCDSCGLDFYASEIRTRWDGLKVCEADYETRHPQDFVRGIPDNSAPPWVRPDTAEESITNVTGITTLASTVFSVYITGTGYTVTMPLASSVTTAGDGIVLQTGDTATSITLARQGSDLINYETSISLKPNTRYLAISDNVSNWTVQ